MSKILEKYRKQFHKTVLQRLIRMKSGTYNFADKDSKLSSHLATLIVEHIRSSTIIEGELTGQTAGCVFEEVVLSYLKECFHCLRHLRPGDWGLGKNIKIADFVQYAHLVEIARLVNEHGELAASVGRDYIIKPDIVMWREPETDKAINATEDLVNNSCALHTILRRHNNSNSILHASISCKWTMRSDRSQNSRTEALNLIRNRKGHLPHIVVVTAEPLPSRLASIALGTGDIDCTYHFALYELVEAARQCDHEEAINLLNMMIEGKRLRDISDLPLDLAI